MAYVMLGRSVVRNSLATLAKYGPRTMNVRVPDEEPDAFASMPSAQIRMGGSSKGLSAQEIQAAAKIGAAIGSYFRDQKWGTQTQSAGYQAQRAGERQAY